MHLQQVQDFLDQIISDFEIDFCLGSKLGQEHGIPLLGNVCVT